MSQPLLLRINETLSAKISGRLQSTATTNILDSSKLNNLFQAKLSFLLRRFDRYGRSLAYFRDSRATES
jgi:hypothetical protein